MGYDLTASVFQLLRHRPIEREALEKAAACARYLEMPEADKVYLFAKVTLPSEAFSIFRERYHGVSK